jgi:hypothetical protein
MSTMRGRQGRALNEIAPFIAQNRFGPLSNPVQMVAHARRIDGFGHRQRVSEQERR